MERARKIFPAIVGVIIALRQSEWIPIPVAVVGLLLALFIALGAERNARICWALVAFLGVNTISLALNLQPATSIRLQRFVALTIGLLALSPMISTARLDRMRSILFKWLIITLEVMVYASFILWVVIQFAGISFTDGRFYSYGFCGIFPRGMTLAPASAIVGVYAINRIMNRLNYNVLSVVVATIMVLAAGSRMNLAGYLIAVVFLLIVRRKELAEKLRMASGRKFAIGIVGALLIIGSLPFSTKFLVEVRYEMMVKTGNIFQSRERLWNARIVEFESSPVIGIGYAREFPKQDDSILSGTTSADLTQMEPGTSYLSLLSYGGIMGAGAFLWFIVLLLKGIRRGRDDRADHRDRVSLPTSLSATYGSLRPCLLSFLIFMALNALTEGWLLYLGSLLFPIFWLTSASLMRRAC